MAELLTTPEAWPYTVPSLTRDDARGLTLVLQQRLDAMLDLGLTLAHVRWNVTGPHGPAVRALLAGEDEIVRRLSEELAERIAVLGSAPDGRPGALVARRDDEDYRLVRHDALDHVRALILLYSRVITGQREAVAAAAVDAVSQSLLTAQAGLLEHGQWLLRALVETAAGDVTW